MRVNDTPLDKAVLVCNLITAISSFVMAEVKMSGPMSV